MKLKTICLIVSAIWALKATAETPRSTSPQTEPVTEVVACDDTLTSGAVIIVDPVAHRWRRTNWVGRLRARHELKYSLAETSAQRQAKLEAADLEKVSVSALDFIASSDPNWRLRRLALDLATRKIYDRVGYNWIEISDGGANPLNRYLMGFGNASADWRRASVEIVLTATEGRLQAQNVLAGRQDLVSWIIQQTETLFRNVSALARPSMRLEAIDQIYSQFNQALDLYFSRHPERGSRNNPGPDFVAPPLDKSQFRALVSVRDHDSDALVRRHAQDVLDYYRRFGGMAFLMGEAAVPDASSLVDASEAFLRLRQTLPPQTQVFQNSQLNPFRDPSLALPLKNLQPWRLESADINSHFRKPRTFESEAQWLEFIAKLTKITNLSDLLATPVAKPVNGMVAANDNHSASDLALSESQDQTRLRDAVTQFLREVAHFHPSPQVRLGAIVAAVQISI